MFREVRTLYATTPANQPKAMAIGALPADHLIDIVVAALGQHPEVEPPVGFHTGGRIRLQCVPFCLASRWLQFLDHWRLNQGTKLADAVEVLVRQLVETVPLVVHRRHRPLKGAVEHRVVYQRDRDTRLNCEPRHRSDDTGMYLTCTRDRPNRVSRLAAQIL